MSNQVKILIALFLAVWSVVLFAATKTVTLSVPSMDCVACPITIKKSLEKIDGVKTITVSYESKTVAISFDDQKTDISRLLKATENVGYPAIILP